MNTNIHAYTENCAFPGYVSINFENPGENVLTVRKRGYSGRVVADLAMTDAQLVKMAEDILARLRPVQQQK